MKFCGVEKLWSSRKVKEEKGKRETKEIFCHIINFLYTLEKKKCDSFCWFDARTIFHWYSSVTIESRNMTKCVASHVCFFLTTWELALNSRLCASFFLSFNVCRNPFTWNWHISWISISPSVSVCLWVLCLLELIMLHW